jgi:hypothetical protein
MHSFVLGVFSFLIFILSINGTMALRNTLAIILLVSLIALFIRGQANFDSIFKSKEFRWIVGSLVVFVLYVLFHSIYLSHEMLWSLSEFKSHIFYPFLYFTMGILLASYVSQSEHITKETLVTILFYSLFIHILYLDLVAIDKLIHHGEMTHRYGGLMDSPVLPNYITNILLAMIIAEFVYRLRVKKQILKVSDGILYLLLGLCIFSAFIEGLRIGDIALVFLGIGASTVYLYNNSEYSRTVKGLVSIGLVFILTVPLIYNLIVDKRWERLVETVPTAIKVSENKHWINRNLFPPPKTESGIEVKGSNYERIAWATKGLEYIVEDPLGIGFGRNSFGHAKHMMYPELARRGGTSHSSIIDLTLGIGIIGLSLWLYFVYLIFLTSKKEFVRSYNYFAILTLFILLGFVGRSFFDANMRDHMFLQFMIILGISLTFMALERNKGLEQ